MKTTLHQTLGAFAFDTGYRRHLLDGAGDFLLEAQLGGFFFLDLDVPTGELGGQARVLALFADRQRQLIGVDDDFHGMTGFIDDQVLQLGGRKRVGDKLTDIRVPADDVDLLAAEFAHDILHAHPPHAHAGADGINLFIVRHDGDLGAVAGFARDPFDLHRLVGDFRNFELEKFPDEVGMASRQNDLRAMHGVVDAKGVGTDAIARLVFLGGHTLATGHDAFDLAEVDDDVAPFEPAHGPGQDVARAALELLENHVLLDLPDALQHRLLGGLCGDTAKILGGDFDLNGFAKLGIWQAAAGVGRTNIVLLVDHIFDHQQIRESANGTGLAVDLNTEVACRTDTSWRLAAKPAPRLGARFPCQCPFRAACIPTPLSVRRS